MYFFKYLTIKTFFFITNIIKNPKIANRIKLKIKFEVKKMSDRKNERSK